MIDSSLRVSLSIRTCLFEALKAVLGGRCLPRGSAGQLGLRTANRQHLHPERSAQRRYLKIDKGLGAVPVMRADLVDRSHGYLARAQGRAALVHGNNRGLNRR